MPDPLQCEWEWNGSEWVKLSGPAYCAPPPDPRAEPGEKKTVDCPEPVG